MSEIFSVAVLVGILTSAIRLATPYLYAAIGETIGQTSGVLNLGVEGIMLVSGYAAFFVVLMTGSIWLGLLIAIVVGVLMGLLMSVISVTLKAEQGISGIGLFMFGLGLSSLLFKTTIGTVKTVTGFSALKIPLLGDIPVIGPIFFQQSLLVYGAFLMVPLATWLLNKTTLGLKIRAVGQNPAAADSLGVNVDRIRYFSVCLGAALAGVAGASLSISLLNLFQENMTAGMGFIAVAAGLLRRVEAAGYHVGCAALQHGELDSVVDAGVGGQYFVRRSRHAAIPADHRCADVLRQTDAPARGAQCAF